MNLKSSSKSGFTLIELLVVMLILVILGIAGLPAIRENMVRARYAADAVPAISDIRTKVELYRYEHDHLPGMQLKIGSNRLAKNEADTMEVMTSYETEKGYIQTMAYDESETDVDKKMNFSGHPAYVTDTWDGTIDIVDNGDGDGSNKMYIPKDPTDTIDDDTLLPEAWHVFSQIDVNYENLSGRFVKPFNFQYCVPFCRGQDYCWVVAVVGNGDGLPRGTAYAVMEYNNTKLNVKFLATYEMYKVKNGSDGPMNLYCDVFDTKDANAEDMAELLKKHVVIPSGVDGTFPGKKADGDGEISDEDANSALAAFRNTLTTSGWNVQ